MKETLPTCPKFDISYNNWTACSGDTCFLSNSCASNYCNKRQSSIAPSTLSAMGALHNSQNLACYEGYGMSYTPKTCSTSCAVRFMH